jgi:hypothetical protein
VNTIKQLCKPRGSIFDQSRRDVVLDLTDLIENRINPAEFFTENYITGGMRHLLRESFRRFSGHSASGVIKLTQAMGGGKTHNMIALGLLAKHPELRQQVMGEDYQTPHLGKVRVVAFTGRESDAPLGIWGAIAEQLGKKELFKDYYSPLSAPGQTAWINLLKGEPLLILLDELPPYLVNAKSRTIGNTDLAVVTATALSNLLVAVNKDELANVCVVISDLRATYEEGTELINKVLRNLENEVGRVALNLEPVALNTDEIYHILRKRIFADLPDDKAVIEVARAYAKALQDARQMDITNVSPEKLIQQIRESYPFHPDIRDLYARFRENPGYQQTRDLIRLMRKVVADLYSGQEQKADRIQLIAAHDLDLNKQDILTEISNINPSLDNAISHDIASGGQAVAEIIDANMGGSDARDVATLLLISSLSNVQNAVIGLSLSEIVAYLCAPGRDLAKLKEVLGTLSTKAWYLHASREGKLFFKNVQNLVAKLKTLADTYNRESAIKELRNVLAGTFTPTQKDCYQELHVLPALDEIRVGSDKVVMIIYEPYPGGLHPDLLSYYNDLDYKNRILFLSGQKDNMENLLEVAKEHRAISSIIDEMDQDKLPSNDPQRISAQEKLDKIILSLLSAARETFVTLTYPYKDGLVSADFRLEYSNNQYKGEQQVRETLKSRQKFTEDVASDTFRKKCEARLFTQKVMLWTEVKKRAATNTTWQWHRPDALDLLKEDLIYKDQWREQGGYVEKGPFPPPVTSVQIQERHRDENTGELTLTLTPVYGDQLFYEINAPATSGSLPVSNAKAFKTTELLVSFLCVDSSGKHQTGDAVMWKNRITIKSRTYHGAGGERMVELRAIPDAPIRYTTDGSDPRLSGGSYNGPFAVPAGTLLVLAVAEKDGIVSEQHRLEIRWGTSGPGPGPGPDDEIDLNRPAIWRREHVTQTTKDSYELLGRLEKYQATLPVAKLMVVEKSWAELNLDEKLLLNAEQLNKTIGQLRSLLGGGEVSIEAMSIHFPSGQHLLDWVAEVKTEIKPGEVEQ